MSRSRSPERRGSPKREAASRSRSPERRRSRSPRSRAPNSEKHPDELFSIMVQHYPRNTERDELDQFFGKYGTIAEINVPRDYHTREPRGIAFIRFHDKSSQTRVIEDHKDRPLSIGGKEMRVEYAYTKPRPGDRRWNEGPPPQRGYGDFRPPDRREHGGRRDRHDDRDRYERRRSPPRYDERRRSPPRYDDRRRSPARYDDRREPAPRHDDRREPASRYDDRRESTRYDDRPRHEERREAAPRYDDRDRRDDRRRTPPRDYR